MRILPYYILHTFINSIKKLFRTWVAVFLIICFAFGVIGGIAGVVIGSVVEDSAVEEEYIEEEYTEPDTPLTDSEKAEMLSLIRGAVILITLAVVLFSIYGGDKNGTKIFNMADVNLLFPSPLKPQTVLMFKMILQMGVAIISSLYILFQIPNLVTNVGLSLSACISIFIAYAFLLYYSRLASVFTYTVTATKESRKKLIRPAVIAVLLLLALAYIAAGYLKLDYFQAFLRIFSFESLEFIPIFGWLAGLIMASANRKLGLFLIFLCLNIAACIILSLLIWKIKADFYEDALTDAAKAQEMLEAAQTGRRQRKKERSEKIKRNSEFKGVGAYIFFEKTVYNRRRFAKFGIFTPTSITYFLISFAATAGLYLIFDVKTHLVFGFILLFVIFFRNLGNPLAEEMSHDFIYTVPESPAKKLYFSILGSVYETALDLLPAFIFAGAVLPQGIAKLVLWLVLCLSLDIFCSAVGLFTEMVIPSSVVQAIKAMLGMIIRMLAIIPGLIMVIISAVLGTPWFIIATVILNIGAGAALLAVSPIFLHTGKK